jgi:hypothetical protein
MITSYLVPAGNSTPCAELIQSITKNCSTNSLVKSVFPTEVLLEEMVKEDCTYVNLLFIFSALN